MTVSSSAFLAAAAAEIGYSESPAGSNCNRYSRELGRPCERWCADFLAALARRLGLALPSTSASTRMMAAVFRSVGRWSSEPAVGAWAFWDFDGDGIIQHVSVVESWTAATITTIDGNTSPAIGAGAEDNGGGVWRRTRPRSLVVGYGRPDYLPEDDMAWTDAQINQLLGIEGLVQKDQSTIKDLLIKVVEGQADIRDLLHQLVQRPAGPGVGASADEVADKLAQRLQS